MSNVQNDAAQRPKFDFLDTLPYAGLALAGLVQIAWITGLGYAAWLIARTAL